MRLANEEVETLTRHVLRYHGSKRRIGPWIIAHFPPHTCYVEPFGGGAGVLLQKEPADFEVYNDLERSVVNFFDVLRNRPDELIRAIELTPYSRVELERAQQPAGDPLEDARRFYVLSYQQHHGGRGRMSSGWRIQRKNNRGKSIVADWNHTDHLHVAARRLKRVQIECDDALNVIPRFDGPETLFYVDPPYVWGTRSERWRGKAYLHEMSDDEHRALAAALREIEGMAIVSGYPSDLYDRELFSDWRRVNKETIDGLSQPQVECLWLSPRTWERLQAGREQTVQQMLW